MSLNALVPHFKCEDCFPEQVITLLNYRTNEDGHYTYREYSEKSNYVLHALNTWCFIFNEYG